MTKRSKATTKTVTGLLGNRLGSATVLFHGAVAEALGMGLTDSKTHAVLMRHGAMTAGALAKRVRLTTGAVTGVVDRLVKLQLVRRVADPKDRRRVVVTPVANPKRAEERKALLAPLSRRIQGLVADYSAREQALVADFLNGACAALEMETTRLTQKVRRGMAPRARPAG